MLNSYTVRKIIDRVITFSLESEVHRESSFKVYPYINLPESIRKNKVGKLVLLSNFDLYLYIKLSHSIRKD